MKIDEVVAKRAKTAMKLVESVGVIN